MMRTVWSLLTLIAGTAGLCVEEADVARICTAGTELGQRLSLALEGCGEGCERGQTCVRRSISEDINYRTVLGLERQSSHYCSTTDEIESLFHRSLESKWLVSHYCSSVFCSWWCCSGDLRVPVPGLGQ